MITVQYFDGKSFLITLLTGLVLSAASVFAQSPPDESPWSEQFAEPGLGLGCLATAGANGQLYCANGFESSIPGTGYLLAIWDGSSWRREGPGLFSSASDELNALAVVGTDVYLGGNFTVEDSNGEAVENLARWDGEAWHAVGLGVNGTVYALATTGTGDLYVGGVFTQAGGQDVRNIARWDGAGWSPLFDQGEITDGTNGRVTSIIVGNDGVYVGGRFTTAGGANVNYVARWNPTTPSWGGMGVGVQTWVEDVAIGGDGNLYVGGLFETAGGEPANRVARWDGDTWSALGSGSAGTVDAVGLMPNGDIVAAGDFSADAGTEASALAVWDGTQWQALVDDDGSHPSNRIWDISTVGSDVYVAGNPFFIDGLRTNGVAKWDGSRWSGLGEGIGYTGPTTGTRLIQALLVVDGEFYAGGMFEYAGPDSVDGLARWDGSDWHALGEGLDDVTSEPIVQALASDANRMYVGGEFSHAGGSVVGSIAAWDGDQWASLDGGFLPEGSSVNGLAIQDGVLFATGAFEEASGQVVNGIASWDGDTWSPLGGGVSNEGYALTTLNGDLYVGGNLFYANGGPLDDDAVEVNNLARWDGSEWHDVGGGVNGPVFALSTDGTNLFVAGHFSTAGTDVEANNIAKWDGSTWTPLGTGLDGRVFAIHLNGNDVYAGGEFTLAGESTVNAIARWNGAEWQALDAGVFPATFVQARGVYALEGSEEGLYVGGTFGFAGDQNSLNVALWTDFEHQPVSVEKPTRIDPTLALYPAHPNPFSSRAHVTFETPVRSHVRLTVYDLLGRRVDTLVDEPRNPGRHNVTFDARGLTSGIYFYTIEIGSFRSTRSMMLVR